MEQSSVSLRGTYLSTEYQHDSGWGLYLIKADADRLVTLCGTINHPPISGESVTVEGQWSRFKSKGLVFEFTNLRAVAPRDPAYFSQFLAAIGDIPSPTAELITNAFGKNTLLVLSRSPEKLTAIQGLSETHRKRLLARWRERRQQDHLEDELLNSGLNPDLLLELSHRLPAEISIKDVLSKDPWLTYIFTKTPFYQVKEFVETTGSQEVGHFVEAGMVATARRALMQGKASVSESDLQAILPQLLGLSSAPEQARINEAIEWLSQENILFKNDDDAYVLREYANDRNSVISLITDLQQSDNEVTDQLSVGQLKKLIESDGALADLAPAASVFHKFLSHKVFLVDSPHSLFTTKFTKLIDALESALHFDVFHLQSNYVRASDARKDSIAFLGRSESAPPQRGAADPIDADLIVIHDAHLLTITDLVDLLPAIDASSNVVFIANLALDTLQIYGSPARDLSDTLPVLNLADYCANDSGNGVKQVLSIVNGDWRPAGNDDDLDFDSPLMSISCDDDEISEIVEELCFGELPEALGFSPRTDVQLIATRPKTRPGLDQLKQLESRFAECFKKAWDRDDVYRGILKSPLPRFDLPHYLSGTLEQDDEGIVFFHAGPFRIKLHPSEARHITPNYIAQTPTAQQMSYPFVVVILHSWATISKADLLAAMACSSRWTVLVGSPGNFAAHQEESA